jgi:hypothetical protein
MSHRVPFNGRKSKQRRDRQQSFARFMPNSRKHTINGSTTQETPLRVWARGFPVDDLLREYVRRRVGLRLGKYAARLTGIVVWLDNIAGPKGAPAYACKFKVRIPGCRAVVVAAEAPGARAAFDAAADATERTVRRRLDRRRHRYGIAAVSRVRDTRVTSARNST